MKNEAGDKGRVEIVKGENMKIGFIGCGNMASAIIGGILKNGIYADTDIYGMDLSKEAAERVRQKYNINIVDSDVELAKQVDLLVLSVKPQYYEDVIGNIREAVTDEQIIITIAPGKTLKWLREEFAKHVKIVRAMPNTPAQVGEGMTALCMNAYVTEEELEAVEKIFSGIGKYEIVQEDLMDTVTAVSGSSPAYVFMMIEAMADAAVMGGMQRAQAYEFAAQAVAGSAKMVLETGRHPADLKDMVCSPRGTTIEAVKALEEKGFRSALIEGMCACMDKASKM